jgi:Flp pilus assembly protein TadG
MKRHSERGSSLPEMAIAAVAVLSLLFGIVDFGRALYTYGFIAQLAREGARWAIVRGSTSCTNGLPASYDCNATTAQIQSYVQSLSEGATTPSNITVTTTYPSCPNTSGAGSNAPGCTVAVNVKYPFKFVMGFMPSVTITMSSTSTMVISQ